MVIQITSSKTDQYREGASLVIAPSSKTDQYREGASLVIARTGTATCPISMMQRYFSMGQLVHDYLFGGIIEGFFLTQ